MQAAAKKIFDKQMLDWPNVFLPNGWNDAMRSFNISGYGNIVVDKQGIVRGVHVHGAQLERLARELSAVDK